MSEIITNNKTECARAMDALRGVIDPEIGLNIVDLGLVYQIDFDEETNEIFLAMTLTTQFCPMGESIRDSAESVMQDAFPGYRVHIHVIFDPPWTSERISQEGREFLNQ